MEWYGLEMTFNIYSNLSAMGSPMELGILMQALKITAIHPL